MRRCLRKILPVVLLLSCYARAQSLDPSVALPVQVAARPVPQVVARMDSRDGSWPESRAYSRSELNTPAPRASQPSAPSAAFDTNSAQVRDMIQSMDRSAFFVNTVSARMNVTIKRGDAKAMTLDGVYVGDANGNLRLRLTGIFGILAMDVTVKDGTLTCWMPTKKLLVQATREELLNDGNSELAVLAAVGQARELFFPRPWADGASQRRLYANGEELRIGVFGGAGGRCCLRDYAIDPLANAIRSLDVLTEAGQTVGRVEYANYQALTKLDSRGEKDGEWRSAFKVPRNLRLADGQNRLTLECELEGLKVNEALKATAFDMELPKGVTPQKAQALEQAAREMAGVAAKP